jgi:hypothetical protein
MKVSNPAELSPEPARIQRRLSGVLSPRIIGLVLGLAISVVAGYFAVRDVSWAEISDISGTINWSLAFAAVLMLVVADFLRSVRWMALLRTEQRIPLSLLFQLVMVGLLLNLLIPLRAGDFFRAVVLRKKLDIPYGEVGASLVAERLFDVITLAIVFAVFALGVSLPGYLIPVLAGFTLVAVVGAIVVFAVALFQDRLLRQISKWENARMKLVQKLSAFLSDFVVGLSPIKNNRNMAEAWGYSFAVRFAEIAAIGLVLMALDINIGVKGFALVNSLTMLGLAIPSGPGAVGSFELLARIGIETFDVAASQSLFGAVFIHAIHIVATLAVGSVASVLMYRQLKRMGIALRSVTSSFESDEDSVKAEDTDERAV